MGIVTIMAGLNARIAELKESNTNLKQDLQSTWLINDELRIYKARWLALFGEGQREKWSTQRILGEQTDSGDPVYRYLASNNQGGWIHYPTPEALADALRETDG